MRDRFLEVVEVLAPNTSTRESDPAAVAAESLHGVEFKPIERPVEAVNFDQPVKCPLPEPCILSSLKQHSSCTTTNITTPALGRRDDMLQSAAMMQSLASPPRSRNRQLYAGEASRKAMCFVFQFTRMLEVFLFN
ncbi:unnamed protein product [Urochloa humidicola]